MEYWTIMVMILAVVIGVYYCLSSKDSNVFQQHGIPHMEQKSILRSIIYIFAVPVSYVQIIQTAYNLCADAKYIGIFSFNTPTVMIRDLELIKSIAIKNFDSFEDHYFLSSGNTDPLFQNNLVSLRGDKWRDVRALLSPAFTSSKIKAMFHLLSECAINFSEYLKNLPSERRAMEMKDIFTRYGTDAIATCAFGISVDSMRNPENDFYVYGKKGSNFDTIAIMKILLFQNLPTLAQLFKFQIVDNRTYKFFINLVADTIKTRDEKNITRPDMLQLMMDSRGKREHGKELTVQEMTSHAFGFFLGGFESSSTAMCFAAHEIAVNPDVQKKLHDEIDKALNDTNGQPSYEAINGMTYLNAVISETLRIYPPTLQIDRSCVKDFELPAALPDAKPYLVKKGMLLWLPYYAIQHDAKYFPEPDKFKPERFIDKSERDRCNFDAYHPFGLGPRMCLGNRFALLQTKVLLFHLLARCELKTCEKTPLPLKFKKRGFSLLAEGGFWLDIVPRENTHSTITIANKAH